MKKTYKTPLKYRIKALKNYYKNRIIKIKYQREYDKTHPEIKKAYDKKRRLTTDKNSKRKFQRYSTRNHLPKLMKMFGGCQECGFTNKLEIHHKRYSKNLGDCMLLCQPCHKKLHRIK